ncbi:MAG: hypothetical protein E6Q24_07100 [Chitinophagaceae bacterium]|nr:MAG: hypothetical protein E6Q24_07100 [Chitinophagaceae bacterium]
MQVTAHFSKIRHHILEQLHKAQHEVHVAIAWLTDEDIIRELAHLQLRGVQVKIVISNSKENFANTRPLKEFIATNGALFVATTPFLHHKFCIIDNTIIINGSYNWSYAARSNEENITILTRQNDVREENLVFTSFQAKHSFLCNKCAVPITDPGSLDGFRSSAMDTSHSLSILDEQEIALRLEFQEAIKRSFAVALSLDLSISPGLLERMERDGGGVEFVKRILHDEMTTGEMKSGFKKLAEHIPHKVELSLEYLVSRPQFVSLFTVDEVNFCTKLMAKYHL